MRQIAQGCIHRMNWLCKTSASVLAAIVCHGVAAQAALPAPAFDVAYGVQDRHYATVGEALLWTLEQGLGPAFTPEVRLAWTSAYGLLAGAMQAGAREAAAMQADAREPVIA